VSTKAGQLQLYLKTRVCKPVLQRLDEALSSGGASYDELISIEHVLPQTVDTASEWATLFQDEAERTQWTHRLANLVLLTRRINTRASNWDFERKKREYFSSKDGSSPFVLTQGVLRTPSWSTDHLKVAGTPDTYTERSLAVVTTTEARCSGGRVRHAVTLTPGNIAPDYLGVVSQFEFSLGERFRLSVQV
jgi:hypothetical protein